MYEDVRSKRWEIMNKCLLYYLSYPLCLTFCLFLIFSGCATPKAEIKKTDTQPSPEIAESNPDTNKVEGVEKRPSLKKIYAEPLSDSVKLIIEATDPLQYTAFKLNEPLRIILDLSNIEKGPVEGPIHVDTGAVGTVNLHYFEQSNTSRVEIGLNTSVSYEILKPSADQLVVSIKNPEEKTPEKGISGEPAITVSDIDVQRTAENNIRIIVKTEGGEPRFTLIKKDKLKRLSLEIENARVSSQGQKALDTSLLSDFVKKVSSYQFKDEPSPIVKVIAELVDISSYNIYRDGANIVLDIEPPGVVLKAEVSRIEQRDEATERLKPALGKTEGKTEIAVFDEKRYGGKRISMDFQDADISNILRLIAEVSELNVITTEDVKGKVSMRLVDVPWDQALDVILKTNRLDMIREENIIRIAPATRIAEERKAVVDARKATVESKMVEEEVEELFTEIFSISYAKAADLTKNLDKVKSKRGDITIDERTNTLIIKDIKRKIRDMKSLIEKLDKRTPQVLIEARIVEVNRNFSKELGIEWGGKFNLTTDANFPNTVGVTGSSVGTNVVSLPAAAGSGTGGAISATLGSVTGANQLDIRLSALESTGKARILSTPKITASDNKEAVIESGRQIPYATVSAAGTAIQFIDATISLTVTPHITPDNYISMRIVATKNEADFANQVQGTPSIIKKKANTEVLIKDGDTTVIGGLYKTTKQENIAGVPWFMKIPVIGWLFKKKTDKDDGEELLIFITPKIIRA
jgi:type IV pilus assembly protein PilQ